VADGGGAGEGGNFVEGDFCRVGQGVGEGAEAGTEDEADFRAEWGALEDGVGGGFGESELVSHSGAKARLIYSDSYRSAEALRHPKSKTPVKPSPEAADKPRPFKVH
jgi:hypothetical protein